MHVCSSIGLVLPLALSAWAVSCTSSSTSGTVASATDLPPLPPSTETSIALLLSHREQVGLSEEQVTFFTTLESELNARNEPLEVTLQEMQAAPKRTKARRESSGGGQAMGRGGRGGRGGGQAMGRGGRGGRGGGRGGGQRSGPPPSSDTSDTDRNRKRREHSQQIRVEMMSNNAASLEQAFGQLSDEQKPAARKVLEDEGHEAPQSDS